MIKKIYDGVYVDPWDVVVVREVEGKTHIRLGKGDPIIIDGEHGEEVANALNMAKKPEIQYQYSNKHPNDGGITYTGHNLFKTFC